jgi:peptide/nickel transport system substrate-binding protein
MGGPQWGEPSSFNPLASNPDWPVKTPCNLLYENLLMYNATTGEMQPSLAQSFRKTVDGIEISLDPRARWSDGKPLTADDVVYTFNLGKQHKSIPIASAWAYLALVTKGSLEQAVATTQTATPQVAEPSAAEDERRVSFVFTKAERNPLFILDALQETRIIAKHIIEPIFEKLDHDQNEFLELEFDEDPVVSGPYRLHSYSSEKIALERRDDYWGNEALHGGKRAAPKYVVHPVYKSNDHYSVALQQGRLDLSSNFVPRIWLKRKKGVRAWFDEPPFFIANSMPMMLFNVSRGPLGDPAYRRAMAFSVNYKDIQELAVSGYSDPLQPGLIIPFGPEAKYYSREDVAHYGATRYAPEQARAELHKAGYQSVFDDEGNLVETRKDGKKVETVYIKSPTGWTDWESVVRIAVKGMRAAGIDARERFIDGSVFWQATATGDFDLIMNTPKPAPLPSQPWSRFDAILTSRDWKPIGEKMYKNQGRFNDPTKAGYIARFDELLALIPQLTKEADLVAAYRELNVLFMQQQPTLPMVYRPAAFYQISTKTWQGFPLSTDPYLPPEMPGERLGTSILWHLELATNH